MSAAGSERDEVRRTDDAEGREDRAPTETPSLMLQDALKLAGFADTGGQAKTRIQAGEIRVNGQVETRRKRRLRPGDEIIVDGETFVIELEE